MENEKIFNGVLLFSDIKKIVTKSDMRRLIKSRSGEHKPSSVCRFNSAHYIKRKIRSKV